MRLLIFAVLMFGVLLAPSGWVMAEAASVSVNMSENSVLAADDTLAPEGFGVADNDHRAPFHLDSIFALAMLFSAFAIAIGLNHPNGLVRRSGYFSCAVLLFAVGGLLLWLRFDGVFEDFKEIVYPPDGAKPFVLTLQAAVAVVGGLYLLGLALRNKEAAKKFHNANEQARYGLISRYLHWSIAIVFLLLVPMGVLMSALQRDAALLQYLYVVHKALGFTLLLLVFVRLTWNRTSSRPALSVSLRPWETKLAHVAHISLYVMLFAFPISGYVMSTAAGKWSHFFFVDVPLLFEPSMAIAKPSGLLHKVLLPYLFYLILFGHIVGALKHRYIDGDVESARRMVS